MIPNRHIVDRVQTLIGAKATEWREQDLGHTRAGAWIVELENGSSAFVKAGLDEASATMLRAEAVVFEAVSGGFLPQLRAWEDGNVPLLILEDLSTALWPPPFPKDTRPLFDALDEIASVDPPQALPSWRDPAPDEQVRWERVQADPHAFLALGVCSRGWLEHSIDTLVRAERSAIMSGNRLVHSDIFSANLCFAPRGCVLVDWAVASIGNRWLDVGFAVLSIKAEGGRLPPIEFPDEPAFAALLAGHNALEASRPLPKWADPASTLRQDQLGDLKVALPWAAEQLGLRHQNNLAIRLLRTARHRNRVPIRAAPIPDSVAASTTQDARRLRLLPGDQFSHLTKFMPGHGADATGQLFFKERERD